MSHATPPTPILPQGTVNLVDAAGQAGIKRFVFMTASGADDPIINPLNLFWGFLFWKKRAEEHLQRSGLSYTIVRPAGLLGDNRQRVLTSLTGDREVVLAPAGTYGLPPRRRAGIISRGEVAECCVEALVQAPAMERVVEVTTHRAAPARSWDELFEGLA